MSARRLVDTNIIVRHVTQDHAAHGAIAAKLFAASDQGAVVLVILPAVFAESVFVLEAIYGFTRNEIANTLATLANSSGVEAVDHDIHIEALLRYAKTNMHFVDCVIAAAAVLRDMPIATFDAGFKKFNDVRIDLG